MTTIRCGFVALGALAVPPEVRQTGPVDNPDDPLLRARSLRSVEEARRHYDEWAERYDHDVFERAGVTGSTQVADLLAEHVPDRTTPVVDLGCGTGAVGIRLAEHGFTDITGLDLSPAMLSVAERTGAYRHLAECDLTQPLDIDARFGAAVSAGTFTTGHVTADAVPRVLTLLRPGATLVWAIAPTLWPGFERALTDARVDIRSSDTSPIRRDTDDRSHIVVAHLHSP